MIRRIVNGAQDVRVVTSSIGIKRFQRHDASLRSDEVHDAGHHGSMTKGSILRLAVQHGNRRLI